MKKILAFVAVAVTAVAMASADPLLVGHGYFGVGLGSTVTDHTPPAATLSGAEKTWNFGSNLDFGAGIGVNIPFGGNFGIQPGVDFYVNNLGYHAKYTLLSQTWEQDFTFSYMSLDIPILFTIKINKFNFAVGPYFSIPVGDASIVATNGALNGDKTAFLASHSNFDNKYSNRTGFNFGATLGIGYEQRLGMGMLVFGGRYMHDFLPIEVKDGENNVVKFWRGALAIDVGYKIPLSF